MRQYCFSTVALVAKRQGAAIRKITGRLEPAMAIESTARVQKFQEV